MACNRNSPKSNPGLMRLAGNPLQKILVVEENFDTINDGGWFAASDYISIRHDTWGDDYNYPDQGLHFYPDKRGNAAFIDGHVEFVPRSFAQNSVHYLFGP